MATKLENEFTQYSLSSKEELAGKILTITNLMVLQNLRAEYAQTKLRLKFDPLNPNDFVQQEAENAGWLNCLSYLLAEHENAVATSAAIYDTEEPEQSTNDTGNIFN